MRIIIPAAGIGKRLQPHTKTTPKPLLPVAGKPVLAHIIDLIKPLDPEEILIVVGHLGPAIDAWVQENCPLPAKCIYEPELLGLGYAVKLALDAIPSGPVLILLGDTLIDADLNSFVASGENVLGVSRVDDPSNFGVVSLKGGFVSEIVEKPEQPQSDMAAVGLYFIKDPSGLRKQLTALVDEDYRTHGEIQLTDGLSRLVKEGASFVPFEIDGWHDCGKVETILKTNARLLARTQSASSPGDCQIDSPVWIDESAMISDSRLGPNVSIQADCQVIGSDLENCIIGEGTKVTNCTIKDSFIEKNSVIKDDQILSREGR